MNNIINRLAGLFTPVKALPEGVYHLQSSVNDEKPYRLHLRMQKNGSGILILNASTVLHLNPTAAEYAFHMIKGSDPNDAAKEISGRYRIKKTEAFQDYKDFVDKIDSLIHSTDLDPVSILGFDQVQPNSAELSAPLRFDCALTYRLPSGSDPINAPEKRVERELTTSEWKSIIDKAWLAGVPHIVFTGGEATLRDDLPELIAYAERNGQVAGLITDGKRFVDGTYLEMLLQTGLDHLMIILPVANEPDWDLIKKVVSLDIFLAVHITVTNQDLRMYNSMLDRLSESGVENISLSMSEPSLQEQMAQLRNYAAELNLRLVSGLPVPYSEAHPVALESLEDSEPVGAGKAWLYIEPDGDVLPAQGLSDKILGNILKDNWEKLYPSRT